MASLVDKLVCLVAGGRRHVDAEAVLGLTAVGPRPISTDFASQSGVPQAAQWVAEQFGLRRFEVAHGHHPLHLRCRVFRASSGSDDERSVNERVAVNVN